MSDYTRRRRIANFIALLALVVLLALIALALRFDTREDRPGAPRPEPAAAVGT